MHSGKERLETEDKIYMSPVLASCSGFSATTFVTRGGGGSACAQAADLTGNGWLDLVIGGHQSLGNANKYDSSVS